MDNELVRSFSSLYQELGDEVLRRTLHRIYHCYQLSWFVPI
jgi:hypothetical protein